VLTITSVGNDPVTAPVAAMSGVAGLKAVALGNEQVELTWKASYPKARLFIERATDGPDSYLTVGAVDGSAGRFIDSPVHIGEEPQYRVVAVEDVSELKATKAEPVDSVRLPEWVSKDNFFALRFTGKIKPPKQGKFNFFLTSDDGSRLFIDGTLVANNDERHVEQTVAGTIRLDAGLHDLEVEYFQHDGSKKLELLWAGPGVHYSEVTSTSLSSLECHYYTGKWWRLPFDRSCAVSEVVRVTKPGETAAASAPRSLTEKVQ
jgi:hypothetical protein